MPEIIHLSITKDEAILLNSCLNALQVIMFNGTSDSADTEQQAKTNGETLKNIQGKLPAFS